ncbi:MAG TPA: peptidylprolyl isomerase [Thermohalobaculum sp.]|nr:peptidylprolyl isomerase [Thermohalobaculum sp.]
MKLKIVATAALGLVPLGLILSGPLGLAQTTEPVAPATEYAGGYAVGSALAEVNGVTLTLGELIAIRRALPEQYQSLPDEVLFSGIVDQIIDQMLLAEAARTAGLDKRPAVALNLLNQQRAILADAYLRREVSTRASPEVVEALYKERYLDAPPEQEVRAAHILVEAEEKAAELKAQLDGGADFVALAAEHGTDGTASKGGDLGWFVKSDMVPEFADAAFAMEPGTTSAPVQTPFGWHIIKLEERRDRPAPALDQVQNELLGEAMQQAQLAIVEELRSQATIVRTEPPLPPQSIREDAMLDAAE